MTHYIRRLCGCLTGLALLVAAVCVSGQVFAQEYFVQQAAGEALLIRINAFEAEFEAAIAAENGEVLLHSGIPGSRLIPVFQYIDATEKTRQLSIKLVVNAQTDRSEFGLELTRLTVWDERSNEVSRAYQLLSFGMQRSDTDSEATWTVKIDSLINAGRIFQQYGMKEMRLWANYMAAHLIQYRLHDYSIVYSLSREILVTLNAAHLQIIELATLQLHAAALIGLKHSGALQPTPNRPDPVQSTLARAAKFAADMGYRFEQAQAQRSSGVEYAEAGYYTQALEQFQSAVEIVDSVGDAQLATDIRESIVAIHATQGNAPASSEVLQEIETQLLARGSGDELALNLLAQGRLFIRNHHYGKALDALVEALNYQNNSAIRRQLNFELARVHYQTGDLDEALTHSRLTDISLDSSQRKLANPVLDSTEALRLMANIYRARAQFTRMKQARSAQGQHKSPSAALFYDRGLDEIASRRIPGQVAASHFRQGYLAAQNAGDVDLQDLSLLHLCLIGRADDSLCSNANVKTAYSRLVASGVPANATEARYLWARILVKSSRLTEAINVMDQLIDEIHFLRYSLPGVLGAWYVERHEELFEYYLGLLVRASNQQGRIDESVSLLALSKIRFIESYSALDVGPGDTELLRRHFNEKFEYLSRAGMQTYLRSLGGNETVLTYHISPAMAQVWVAHRGTVQRRILANPAGIHSMLQEARAGLADIGITSFRNNMDSLGDQLLLPVADLLSETIYWIPAGPLLGFPLDALRIKGRYLAERHQVVNLLSFPANPNPVTNLEVKSMQSIFLAGHPQDYSSDYAIRLDTSTEIRALADIFVGPGLNIVQGAALLPDEFLDQRFTQAELVHLGMPGVIDLKYPAQSSLELSGNEDDPQRMSYGPENIQSQQLKAGLVFLSATRLRGEAPSGFSSQPGLISDFVEAGAQAVIASTWASGGKTDEAFLADIYNRLLSTGNIADSLKDAKRQYLKNNKDTGLYGWAGYQLFIE